MNRRQGYKREGQTHMLTVGGTRGPGRLPPREDGGDQMQLLSEPAPAESGSALKRVFECVVAIFFSEPSPCSEAEAGFWNPVLNRTAPLNSPPPTPTQLCSDLLNHNKLCGSPVDCSGTGQLQIDPWVSDGRRESVAETIRGTGNYPVNVMSSTGSGARTDVLILTKQMEYVDKSAAPRSGTSSRLWESLFVFSPGYSATHQTQRRRRRRRRIAAPLLETLVITETNLALTSVIFTTYLINRRPGCFFRGGGG